MQRRAIARRANRQRNQQQQQQQQPAPQPRRRAPAQRQRPRRQANGQARQNVPYSGQAFAKRMRNKTLQPRTGLKLASPEGATPTLALACYDSATYSAAAHTGSAWGGNFTGLAFIWDCSPGSDTSLYFVPDHASAVLDSVAYSSTTSVPSKIHGTGAMHTGTGSRSRTVASELQVKYTGSMVNSSGQFYVYIGPPPREDGTSSALFAQIERNPLTRSYSMLELSNGHVFAPQSTTTIGRRTYVNALTVHGTSASTPAAMPQFLHDNHAVGYASGGNWDMIICWAKGMTVGESITVRGITHTEIMLPMELTAFGTKTATRDAPHLAKFTQPGPNYGSAFPPPQAIAF